MAQAKKTFYCDIRVTDESTNDFVAKYSIWWRCSAVKKTFRGCDFSFCRFDDVYFRNCRFIDCDFRGSKFIGSNLSGSTFQGCHFDYIELYKTQVTPGLLDGNLPTQPNLTTSIFSMLEKNFEGLGELRHATQVSRLAIASERKFLQLAAFSEEPYYRRKFSGFERFKKAGEYLSFEFKNFVWGGGSSLFRLLGIAFVLLVVIFISLLVFGVSPQSAIYEAFPALMGTSSLTLDPNFKALVLLFRLILIAMFISVFVRRLSHR